MPCRRWFAAEDIPAHALAADVDRRSRKTVNEEMTPDRFWWHTKIGATGDRANERTE
jgi:hypothetical protein